MIRQWKTINSLYDWNCTIYFTFCSLNLIQLIFERIFFSLNLCFIACDSHSLSLKKKPNNFFQMRQLRDAPPSNIVKTKSDKVKFVFSFCRSVSVFLVPFPNQSIFFTSIIITIKACDAPKLRVLLDTQVYKILAVSL